MSQKAYAKAKGDTEVFLPEEFAGLNSCPHCQTSTPSLSKVFSPNSEQYSFAYERVVNWAIYRCSTCSLPISLLHAGRNYLGNDFHEHVYLVFPPRWQPDQQIPETPRRYLKQANDTLANPDASVVMSASAIDAMLKVKGLENGSLYSRIDQAVEDGLLTKDMSAWAHTVRLNSNNPRHADLEKPHLTAEDAKLSLEFAKAIAEVLFTLPSKMPPSEIESSERA